MSDEQRIAQLRDENDDLRDKLKTSEARWRDLHRAKLQRIAELELRVEELTRGD